MDEICFFFFIFYNSMSRIMLEQLVLRNIFMQRAHQRAMEMAAVVVVHQMPVIMELMVQHHQLQQYNMVYNHFHQVQRIIIQQLDRQHIIITIIQYKVVQVVEHKLNIHIIVLLRLVRHIHRHLIHIRNSNNNNSRHHHSNNNSSNMVDTLDLEISSYFFLRQMLHANSLPTILMDKPYPKRYFLILFSFLL